MFFCRLVIVIPANSIDIVQGFDPIGDGFYFDVQVVQELDSAIANFHTEVY